MAKFSSAGIANFYLDFLNSYFDRRLGRVAVARIFSEVIDLTGTFFFLFKW